MRISDWSSDVCSSDLRPLPIAQSAMRPFIEMVQSLVRERSLPGLCTPTRTMAEDDGRMLRKPGSPGSNSSPPCESNGRISDEIGRAHSELQALMRLSHAVSYLKKKNIATYVHKEYSTNYKY